MTSAPPASSARCRAAIATAILVGVLGPGTASAAAPKPLKVTQEPTAATAQSEARAAALTYVKLSAVGVTAGSADLDGRTLTARIRARKTVELRLAVVEGKRITAFKKLTVKPGNYRFSGRLNLTPRGKNLRLRVTARIRGTRGREFVPLAVKTNHAPTALALTNTSVAENSPSAAAVGVFSGTDPDTADTLSYALVAGPGDTDNAAFSVAGSALNTARIFDFETKSSYSVRARVADRSGASFQKQFTITITNANDAPTALTLAPASVAENRPAGTTVGAVSGTDVDGDPLSFALAAGAGDTDNGSFTLTGSTLYTAATFDAETKASYAVRLRASDGRGGMVERALTVTVTDVDDAPVVTTTAGDLLFVENDPATVVDGGVTISDADDSSLVSATVIVTSGLEAATDALLFSDQSGITGSYDAATGRLTLTGTATKAEYQTALRSVRFRSTSDNPATSRTIAFGVNDGDLDSAPATKTVALTRVDDAPTVTTSAGPLAYTEADPATAIDGGLAVTDPDSSLTGATVQITGNHASPEDVLALPAQPGITGSYDSATGKLTLAGTATAAAYQAALQAVTYRNTSSNPSLAQRTVTFVARDASGTSAPATRAIAVSATDNAPDVAASAGSLAYTENDLATAIDTAITVTDVDSTHLTGATVQITGNYAAGEDVLALPAQPAVTATAFDTTTGRLTLSGHATVAEYETALEAVTYRNTSDNPSTAARTITYQARDAGGFGLADTHGVTVTAVDDDPVAVDDSATVTEDSGANAVAVLGNDTDVDGGPKSVASVTQPANGTVVITGGGTGLTYAPNANSCNSPPGGAPDTFTYTLNGGSVATVSMTVTCVDDAPVAVNDSAIVGEDSGANAVAVLSNDTDIDGGPKSVASVTQPANGTVVITGGGTGLTYAPNANSCNNPPGTTPDTFTYTLTPGGSSATVSMTVTCGDDPPVAVNDAATVVEDSGANAVDVLGNDTDV
ncbi:MAG: hypothetical protein JWO02_1951, partial [Solirubrobacterales bacterium]|nr:hypothetical protein [Solirubrobacterales bacterium]